MASNRLVDRSYTTAHPYHTSIQTSQSSLIPPFILEDTRERTFVFTPPANHDFEVGEFISPGFFSQVDPAWFSHHSTFAGQWSYTKRREAQTILPFLYLGPAAVTKDSEFLKKEGINLLLAVRDNTSVLSRMMSGAKAANDLGIQSDSIDIDGDSDLITHFPRAIRRLNEHLVSGLSAREEGLPPKVLIFCETGNEKSAAVVVAYLMVMFNLDLIKAAWGVQRRRFSVNMDNIMQDILHSFQTILDAKRQVTKARQADAGRQDTARLRPEESQAGNMQRKRSFAGLGDDSDPTGDMDIDMGANTGIEDNSEHAKQKPAPFIDRVA